MTREKSDHREGCPFWSIRAMKCQLYREGLFIPLNDHIEIYCQTVHYPQCRQFLQHSARNPQPPENSGWNRRKFERVAVSHRVTLVELFQKGQSASDLPAALASACHALDLGKGGMRLATEQPLATASVVQFSFADSFPQSVQTGQGQVAWCARPQNQPSYQAGIAFQEARLIETMGLYLGLIASIPPCAD